MSALSALPHLSTELIIPNALDLKSECTYNCVSLFLDMFDSMPEQSPTTESKAATTPSVDLFGAGTGAEIHFSVSGTPSSPPGFVMPLTYLSVLNLPHPPPPRPALIRIHSSWFVPHRAMRTVHVSPLVRLSRTFIVAALYLRRASLPPTLILFFAPPPRPPCFSPFFLALCLLLALVN